jgi:hypothetical protein
VAALAAASASSRSTWLKAFCTGSSASGRASVLQQWPIGVQIVAPFGHDAVALEIARRLETLTPWADRWPALASTV